MVTAGSGTRFISLLVRLVKTAMPLEHIFTISNTDKDDRNLVGRYGTAALNGPPGKGTKAESPPLFCHCQSLGKPCHPRSRSVFS